MVARKCDKCGKLYEYYIFTEEIEGKEVKVNAISLANFNIRGDYCDSSYYDLCPDCMKELISFLNNKGTADNNDCLQWLSMWKDDMRNYNEAKIDGVGVRCDNCGAIFPVDSWNKIFKCSYCNSQNAHPISMQ